MPGRLRPYRAATVVAAALVAVSACSTAPAAVSKPATSAGATSAPLVTTAPVASPVSTVVPTPSSTKALPIVDLVLSGDYSIVAKGTRGHCTPVKDSSGKLVSFGFDAGEADYPGLGDGLYVDASGVYLTIKWMVNATTGLLFFGDKVGVSADNRSITLDVDLKGGTVSEHIQGTISCP